MHFISTEKVQEVKKNFLQESGIQFSELEEKVLQFHLSNLEYACGSTLDQVWKTQTVKGCKIVSILNCLILCLQGIAMKMFSSTVYLFVCLFVYRYRQDPGTTMSFLPSSQETTLYSPRATLFYSTNWARASTSALTARCVIQSLNISCYVYL